MSSLAHRFESINARLFEAMGETAHIDGVEHAGMFNRRHREMQLDDGTLVGIDLSFDCDYTDQVAELVEGDPVEIVESNGERTRYCFRRRIPEKGDETKRVILELGA